MGDDRHRERDRGGGSEREHERGRGGGEHREDSVLDAHHGDRRDDDDTTVSERLDQLECRLLRPPLPMPLPFRVGNESSRRCKGTPKPVWNRSGPRGRGTPRCLRRSVPRRSPALGNFKFTTEFLDYVKDAMSSGPTAPASEEALVPLLQSSPAVEAERHGSAKDGKAWPIVLVVRNRESGQATCEH